MKKTFQLKVENKNKDRLVEAIKNEIRKYIKRERKKPLPKDGDFWNFDCKFAKDDETPYEISFVDVTSSIDAAAKEDCNTFYLELVSVSAKKKPRVKKDVETSNNEDQDDEENIED
jgi:hypothetical protein